MRRVWEQEIQPMYLGLEWWGDGEEFHCEESAELENVLKKNFISYFFFVYSVTQTVQWVNSGASCAYMNDSWEYCMPPVQRAWPCCQSDPAQSLVSAFCGGYIVDRGYSVCKHMKQYDAVCLSPYFSEKQQFLWSVQDCQKRTHQILNHRVRQKLRETFDWCMNFRRWTKRTSLLSTLIICQMHGTFIIMKIVIPSMALGEVWIHLRLCWKILLRELRVQYLKMHIYSKRCGFVNKNITN